MDLSLFGYTWLPSQLGMLNPLLVLLLVPLFNGFSTLGWSGLYAHLACRGLAVTPLNKLWVGFLLLLLTSLVPLEVITPPPAYHHPGLSPYPPLALQVK